MILSRAKLIYVSSSKSVSWFKLEMRNRFGNKENHFISCFILDRVESSLKDGLQYNFDVAVCLPFTSKISSLSLLNRLYKGGKLIASEVSQNGRETRASAVIETTRSDNGKEVKCQVIHPSAQIPRSITKRLNVLCECLYTIRWVN